MSNIFKVMITGHRPNKLGGYNINNQKKADVKEKLREVLIRIRKAAEKDGKLPLVISGMALGVDQWWAEVAIEEQIQFHAYVPFRGQESKWPTKAQTHYATLLKQCEEEIIVCKGEYTAWKMLERDRAMVDNADACVAVWDGSGGGTGSTVNYIRKKKKPFLFIDASTLEERWENT